MGVIETGKEIAKLAQQLGSIEIQQKVIDLHGEILQLQEDLQQLRKENTSLKDIAKIDKELILEDNAYLRPSAAKTRQGPFCKRCWDVDRKLVSHDVRDDGFLQCPGCNQIFDTKKSKALRH